MCDCKPDETNPNGNEKVLYQGQYKDCFDRILIDWKGAPKKLKPKLVIEYK